MVRNPLRRQKELIHMYGHRDPQQATHEEHIPSTSTALSDTRSVTDERISKRKEAGEIRI